MSIKGKLAQYGFNLSSTGSATLEGNIYGRNLFSTPGNTWHVDDGITTSGNGRTWAKAFKTITEANAVVSAHDVVLIKKGTYDDEPAAVTITAANTKWLGIAGGRNRGLSETYFQTYGDAIDAFIVDASNVEIAYLSFVNAAGKSSIVVGNGASVGGAYIHDCYFYDVAQNGDYHVIIGTTSYNPCNAVIEDCHFFKGFRGLTIYGNRCTVRGCTFMPMNTAYGIHVKADRYGTSIVDNNFIAVGTSHAGAHGIHFDDTTPTDLYGTGVVMMIGNRFVNFTSEGTCINIEDTALAPYASENYWGNTVVGIA